MKITAQLKKGFTLIELIVVIAILGVLSVVLVTTIDPLDKINAANDSGVISSMAQFGRAMDGYGANNNNRYLNAASVNAALTALNTAGESKITAYSAPSTSYTTAYLFTPAACTSGTTCTGYAFTVTGLQAKKNSTNNKYQYVNGRGCTVATLITQAQLDTLGGASSGAGACP